MARDQKGIFALMFANTEAATKIFGQWRKRLGQVDSQNLIRVSVLTGVSRNNPCFYKVFITNNWPKDMDRDSTRFILVGRVHLVTPETTKNLDLFLKAFRLQKKYALTPACWVPGMGKPEFLFKYGIEKTELEVREAWQVGENDPESLALSQEDDPIIPAGIADAPVTQVLRTKKRLGRRGSMRARKLRDS